MPSRTKSTSRVPRAGAVRQSITLPAPLAVEVRRVAKERRLTPSRALVTLVARGLQAEQDEQARLEAAYDRFMSESDPRHKQDAGKDLIRTIFGRDAIAEDPVR